MRERGEGRGQEGREEVHREVAGLPWAPHTAELARPGCRHGWSRAQLPPLPEPWAHSPSHGAGAFSSMTFDNPRPQRILPCGSSSMRGTLHAPLLLLTGRAVDFRHGRDNL